MLVLTRQIVFFENQVQELGFCLRAKKLSAHVRFRTSQKRSSFKSLSGHVPINLVCFCIVGATLMSSKVQNQVQELEVDDFIMLLPPRQILVFAHTHRDSASAQKHLETHCVAGFMLIIHVSVS